MTTETNLSAEEPSEHASTGAQLGPRLKFNGTVDFTGPGGVGMKASGGVEAPSGGSIETAVAIVIILVGTVLLPAIAAAVLAAVGLPGWLVGVGTAVLVVSGLAVTITVVCRKGWLTG